MTKKFNILKSGKIQMILQAALCCFLWGTSIPVLKTSYRLLEIPSDDIYNRLVLAGIRFLIAGLLILIVIKVREGQVVFVKGKAWMTVLIFGLLNTTMQYLFFYVGVGNTGAIKAVLIDASKPFMVLILAHLLTHDDKITRRKVLGLILGIGGIVLANVDKVAGGGFQVGISMRGKVFLLISSLAYAFAILYGKKALKTIPSTRLNMHQLILGALMLLGFGLIGAGGFHLQFTPFAVVLLIYSAFLSAVAFVLWYHLINKYNASSVTVYMFLVPVFGSIISSIVFVDEKLSIMVVLSLIVLSVSIYLVNKKD